MERKIIHVLLDNRESFDSILPYLEKEDFSDKGQILVEQIKHYYEIDPAASCVDRDILMSRIEREYPKHADAFAAVVAAQETTSSRNIVEEYFNLKKEACGERLGSLLISGKAGSRESMELLEQYKRLCDGYTGDLEEEYSIYQDYGVEQLVESVSPENLIQVWPKVLNDTLDGGVPPGTHILIYARPETGKSMFVINMASKFVQNGHKALYIGNEDPYNMMLMRFINRLSGMTRHEVVADWQRAQDIARDNGYGLLNFVPLHPGSCWDVRRIADSKEPDIIIVDQVRNLGTGKKQFSKVEQLEYVTKYMRDLNKEMGTLGVSVTQAGDSAEGKLELAMNDIDFSNCLAPETPIRMYDGTSRAIKDIQVGEQVMGMDSTPRLVQATGGGVQSMYRVTHKNGDFYDCNEEHILTVKKTTRDSIFQKFKQEEIYDMPLTTFMNRSSYHYHFKGITRGYRLAAKHMIRPRIDPWLLGLWLADGKSTRLEIANKNQELLAAVANLCTDSKLRFDKKGCGYISSRKCHDIVKAMGLFKNKHIPDEVFQYLFTDRLRFLEGIIDGDGHYGGHYYEVALYNSRLEERFKELCSSVGLYCSISKGRAYVSGNIRKLQPISSHKQAIQDSKKDVLSSELTITPLGEGEYSGITVDGDHRYMLANGIVTHNTGMQAHCDIMLGIGMDENYKQMNRRMISIPKNKISGNHTSMHVAVNPLLSKVVSI